MKNNSESKCIVYIVKISYEVCWMCRKNILQSAEPQTCKRQLIQIITFRNAGLISCKPALP